IAAGANADFQHPPARTGYGALSVRSQLGLPHGKMGEPGQNVARVQSHPLLAANAHVAVCGHALTGAVLPQALPQDLRNTAAAAALIAILLTTASRGQNHTKHRLAAAAF